MTVPRLQPGLKTGLRSVNNQPNDEMNYTAKSTAAVAAIHGRKLPSFQQGGQVLKFASVLAEHPDARLIRCEDENTGHRFGRAKCRSGRCEKIGSVSYDYQLWAVWPTKTLNP